MQDRTDNFPFPSLINGKRQNGSILRWPETCETCTSRTCELKKKSCQIATCSYGYDFFWLDGHRLVAGILIQNLSQYSDAKSKRLRTERERIVPRALAEQLVSRHMENEEAAANEQVVRDRADYEKRLSNDAFGVTFLTQFKEEIQKGLSFYHDYIQINAQISQNINTIIEKRYSGTTLEEKLNNASHEEHAIYWASKLLTEKLNVARLLLLPELIEAQEERMLFRFHGLVNKYVQIYRRQAERKKLRLSISGESYSNIYADPELVSIIPHTLLDNAIKYSAKESRIDVLFQDRQNGIYFEVLSFGPRITPQEEKRIFLPFARGAAAERLEEGSGYGLYVAQLVARHHLHSEIKVWQEPRQTKRGHETRFSIEIPWGL